MSAFPDSVLDVRLVALLRTQLELEYHFEKLLNGRFCRLGGCGIETHMGVKLDARVFVGEWLFGRIVDQHTPGFFTYDAMAQGLATGNYKAGGKVRIIKGVWRVRYSVTPRLVRQPLAAPHRPCRGRLI